MAGNFNGTIYGDNVDFSGGTPITGKVTTDGQLLIGATAAPNIRVATLTEGTGIDITNAAGSITIAFDGSEVPSIPTSFDTDSGTATPALNVITIAGAGTISTSGSGSTVTISASGGGDVVGPASATDNALVRFDGTTGKLIQDGVITEDNTGNLLQSAAVSGASFSIQTLNTSNTASSTAYHQVQVAGSTASDAYYIADISGGQGYSWGVDNSDSDAWVLSASTTPGTTNVMHVSTAGEINYPLQPAFCVYLANQMTNVTGDGTSATILYDAEFFDAGGDFASNTFTAPVSGHYCLSATTRLTGILSTHTVMDYGIYTSNTAFNMQGGAPSKIFDNNTTAAWLCSGLFQMDAADTAIVAVAVFNGTKVIDVTAGNATSSVTYFTGFLQG